MAYPRHPFQQHKRTTYWLGITRTRDLEPRLLLATTARDHPSTTPCSFAVAVSSCESRLLRRTVRSRPWLGALLKAAGVGPDHLLSCRSGAAATRHRLPEWDRRHSLSVRGAETSLRALPEAASEENPFLLFVGSRPKGCCGRYWAQVGSRSEGIGHEVLEGLGRKWEAVPAGAHCCRSSEEEKRADLVVSLFSGLLRRNPHERFESAICHRRRCRFI